MDELRYYIASRPKPFIKKEERGELGKFKDGLIKKLNSRGRRNAL